MKLINFFLMALIALFPGCSENSDNSAKPEPEPSWQLVFSDEFDGTGMPDESKWAYDTGGHGFGNNELQYYTEARSKNVRIKDGVLIIEAHKETYEGNDYTSGKLVTDGKAAWKYGRIEVRAKLPSGVGTWPAIWMLPEEWNYGDVGWPENGEIDIMEHVGYDPNVVHGTIHCEAYNHSIGTQKGGTIRAPDAMQTFHDYKIEWNENKIDFYMDDSLYFTFENDGQDNYKTWPFDKEFYLILNLAIGGNWGGARGVDDSIFPVRFEIDHVKVYQFK